MKTIYFWNISARDTRRAEALPNLSDADEGGGTSTRTWAGQGLRRGSGEDVGAENQTVETGEAGSSETHGRSYGCETNAAGREMLVCIPIQ